MLILTFPVLVHQTKIADNHYSLGSSSCCFSACLSFVSNYASCYSQHQSEPTHCTNSVVQDEWARREGEASGSQEEQGVSPHPHGPRAGCDLHNQLSRGPRTRTSWQDSWLQERCCKAGSLSDTRVKCHVTYKSACVRVCMRARK